MQTTRTRNIGIIAHVDAGKTTLSERILLYTGRIRSAGETHDGASRLDHEAAEKAHGITITAAAVTCKWRDCSINLIDTPGHVDFTIEVERSLRVLDGAVCVLDGVAGVEAQTETVWRQADRHDVPRLCFVNKLDRRGADFDRVVDEIRDRLDASPVPITVPLMDSDELIGVLDIVEMRALTWQRGGDGSAFAQRDMTESETRTAQAYRELLLDACAAVDDTILEAVLDDQPIEAGALRLALRAATLAGSAVPITAGSAYRNIGVQPLLDAVVSNLPAPGDGEPLVCLDTGSTRDRREEAALTGLCFKVAFDRHGQTTFVRVYSGVLRRGDKVATSRGDTIRVSRLVRMFADRREDVSSIAAGDIGAIVGPPLATGETLHPPSQPFALESIVAPAPLASVAIEAVTSADEDKLGEALARLVRADPSLRVTTDSETGQRRLSGMGQLHLEIANEKLAADYNVSARIGVPRVAYRQTFASSVVHETTLRKQSGGPGMFAKLTLSIAPGERDSGLVFSDTIKGGAVPGELIRGVRRGVEDAMAAGLTGMPIVDLVVVLVDGATHVKDSSELAFQLAAQRAIVEAAARAGLTTLEPVARMKVEVGEQSTGLVLGDLGRRRGRVLGISIDGERRVLDATVPLAETFGYAASLSSMTQGRGVFRLEPAGYEPC